MIACNARTLRRLRLTWVVWLALLLPLAQSVAMRHAQSHWDSERSTQRSLQHGLHGDACELCLAAAAVTGGAAVGPAAGVSHPAVVQSTPVARRPTCQCASIALAYRSRAPPVIPA